ncbi:EAL domain-containing protein [Pseudoalteromonas tunicata]|uniref:EAL domain-containing protein n=1 Tax=Pseudoalteromonas tunicata TaxID=314281 RepID=UPI00273D2AC1|nr:EAL domain-containing protein [Pseudoalteromonas tunicata]MDP4983987.1 EAL domain-containing protein [Pseudoalteromonas tunicata]
MKLCLNRYQSMLFYSLNIFCLLMLFFANQQLHSYLLLHQQIQTNTLLNQAEGLPESAQVELFTARHYQKITSTSSYIINSAPQAATVFTVAGQDFKSPSIFSDYWHIFSLLNVFIFALFGLVQYAVLTNFGGKRILFRQLKLTAKPLSFEKITAKKAAKKNVESPLEPLLNNSLLGLSATKYHLFIIVEWQNAKQINKVQLNAICLQLEHSILGQFSELTNCSLKCLRSGRMTITLGEVCSITLNDFEKNLHQLLVTSSLHYQNLIEPRDIKLGVCNYRVNDYESIDQALVYQLAEAALAISKSNTWQHYCRLLYNQSQTQLLAFSAQDILSIVQNRRYLFLFQPVFSLESGDILQHEALMRIRHKELGLLCAKQFMAFIETDNEQKTLDYEVLAHILKIMANETHFSNVTVNINRASLLDFEHLVALISLIQEAKVGNRVALEISLKDLSGQSLALLRALQLLAQAKIAIVLDNIEREFVYKTQLTQLNVRAIKLDINLIHQLEQSLNKQLVIKKIIRVAKAQGVDVYATGVESKMELDLLKKLGVKGAQGHFFAEPLQQLASFSQV